LIVALGSDHVGYKAKQTLAKALEADGYDVVDLGACSEDRADYPDYGAAVGREVSSGRADRGIVLCGTGIGVSIAANKIKGVRAALCHDEYCAVMARQHNDANVMAAGARILAEDAIVRMARVFLATPFEGGRHADRVAKIALLEQD